MTATLEHSFDWSGTSTDPNDRQFGDVVESTSLDNAGRYDVLLVGEPYDGAVIGRPGAREGPAAIRAALASTKTHHLERGDVATDDGLRIGDIGDVTIPTGLSVEDAQERIRSLTHEIHDTDALPVFLGGDNSLTVPNVWPLLTSGETIGAVNADAHLDCRIVRGQPSSGTPYRQLHEEGLERLVVVGARHFETSTAYVEYLEERGGTIVSAAAIRSEPGEVASDVLSSLEGIDTVYVSVDVDVLDHTAAPGVSAPTPGGLPSRELFELVRELTATHNLAGFEVVETAPPLCPDGRTATVAARTVAHGLAGVASTRGGTTQSSVERGGNR